MSVFEPSSKCQTDEANSRQMAREEGRSRASKLPPPSPAEFLSLTEEAKEHVLALRQTGTEVLSAVTSCASPSDVARLVSSITKNAEGRLAKLKRTMERVGPIIEKIVTRGSAGHIPDGALQKVWRNANAVRQHAHIQQTCKSALEVFQQVEMRYLEASQAWKRKRELEWKVTAGHAKKMKKNGSEAIDIKHIATRVSETSGLKVFMATSSGSLTQDAGLAHEVRVICPHIFAAAVALKATGGPIPVRAVVDAFENARSVDGWCQPVHHVFQRVTEMANEALHYFVERQECEDFANQKGSSSTALEDLLFWICTLRDMFELPCSVTGSLLALDPLTQEFLPPIFRKFRLPRSKLREAAKATGKREGFHVHVVKLI